jgi:hypothetical protein
VNEIRIGLIFSAVFHVVIAGVAVLGIPSLARELPQLPQPIPIDVVIADEIRVTDPAPIPQEEKKTAPAPAPSRAAAAAPSPRRESVPRPEATPKKTAIKAIEPKTKPRVIPRVTPKAKPNPPSKLDAGRLAALIDKSKKEQAAAKIETKQDPDKLEEAVRRAALDVRRARIATATLVAAVRRKVEECWSIPAGAKQAADLNVRLKIYLTLGGNLARPIEFMDLDRMHEPGQEYFRTAVESAARAVRRCAPYELPKDQYDLWRVIEFNFDPREMVGG